MPGVTKEQLLCADFNTDAGELTQSLTNILFSPEEINLGNATKAHTEGVQLLDV